MNRPYRRAMLLALLVDRLGEPPSHWHPVVWMGRYLNGARGCWKADRPLEQGLEGGLGWAVGSGLALGAGLLAARWPWPVQALLLKPLLARRALFQAVREVEAALQAGDLSEARLLLAWHLVSRDTRQLSESEVIGACLSSLAENLSDSVVAPLLAYRVGGLPLAALYRFSNTADALWGYRQPPLEYAGKVAARADDLLNLLPARLTAVATLLAAPSLRGWRIWRADRRRTASPNAGHPMSAFAGALDVRLEKQDAYVLHPEGRLPELQDLDRALVLARRSLFWAVFFLLIMPLSDRWPRSTAAAPGGPRA